MKSLYTKETMVADIKVMDKRTQTMSAEQIDVIIDEGYSNIGMFAQLFSNEEIVSMADYYDASNPDSANAVSEMKLTMDVEEDCLYIYDLYGTVESVSPLRKVYNADAIYQDGRYTGRFHVDLNLCETIDNVVVKYTYTPQAIDADIYVDKPTYAVMKQAFRVAIDAYVKDDKREAKDMAKLEGMCLSILPNYPFDMGSRNY